MSELKPKNKLTVGTPTQQFLKISEIREDTLVVQDGTLRAFLAVSSTNFDLKNEEEQNALIFNYQRFLNSLDFPIQILMQSRKMDISSYTERLKHVMERQTNELLRMQTAEYIEFINRLVESANVMNKSFYVVVPYSESITPAASGLFSRLLGTGKVREISDREQNFMKYKKLLDERIGSVASNLGSIGLRAVRMNTEQIIELMYNSYNFSVGPPIDASQLDNISLTEQPQ